MLVTIHQPEHLPWLGFVDKACRADTLVLLDNVSFRKNYFQNRNRVRSASGPVWLTVPVLTKGRSGQLIKDVAINTAGTPMWGGACSKTLKQCYGKAEGFDEHWPFFRDSYSRHWNQLAALNEHLVRYLFRAFGVEAEIIRASDLNVSGSRSELLLQICKVVGADAYLSGVSGREYLDSSLFEQANVEVLYQEFHHPVYRQLHEPFMPLMSSVDLLFTHGARCAEVLMGHDTERLPDVFE